MDQERERIQDDLRGLVGGDVRCDDVLLQLYASDASIYEIRPMAVVRPRKLADVVAVRANMRPRTNCHIIRAEPGRGWRANRSAAASCSTSRATCGESSRSTLTASVFSPAWSMPSFNERLRPLGRQFGPDPAMSSVTTMGSVIAIDAGGSHWLKHGSAPAARSQPADRVGRWPGDGGGPGAGGRTAMSIRNRAAASCW